MYTASLYCSLISVLSHVGSDALQRKTIGMFSYGSGIASTLFTLQVVGDVSGIIDKLYLTARLRARRVASPQEYEEVYSLFLLTTHYNTRRQPISVITASIRPVKCAKLDMAQRLG